MLNSFSAEIPVWSLKMDSSNSFLACGLNDGTIQILTVNLTYQYEVFIYTTQTQHTNVVSDLIFVENLNMLISSSWDSTVIVWHMTDFSLIHTFLGHTNKVNALLSIVDHDRLLYFIVSSSNDNTIIFWDLLQYQFTPPTILNLIKI